MMILLVLLTQCASDDMWLLPLIPTDVSLRGVGMGLSLTWATGPAEPLVLVCGMAVSCT